MKKRLFIVVMVVIGMFCLAACSGGGDSADSGTDPTTAANSKANTTYQSILDEYTAKIEAEVPNLIAELNAEGGSMDALMSKTEKLAEIQGEGVNEMAELMVENGDDYSTYEEWVNKLYDASKKATDDLANAYMNKTTP